MYYRTFVITYANPFSQIGWWGLICITTVWLFLSSSITQNSLASDSYLSLLPNQRTNICNNCDYGNLRLYNYWDTDSNWFQFLLSLVGDSEEPGSSHRWAAARGDESLALGTLREREHRLCQESHHLSEAFYQKCFARGILLSRRFV